MSQTHGETVGDRQNVLDVFNKRFNMHEELSGSSTQCIQDPSGVSFCKSQARKFKVKRLKTHKERSQFRSQKGQETKQSYRQYSRREVKTSKCSICRPKCQKLPLSREPLSGRTFSKQEPCIITDSRLIGHRGLFSHEVKSINIVRLLTDQSRKTDGGRRENLSKICTTKNTVPSACYPSPDPGPSAYCHPVFSPCKKSRKKSKEGITQINTNREHSCITPSKAVVLEKMVKTGESFLVGLISGEVEKTGFSVSQQDSNSQGTSSLQEKFAADSRFLSCHSSENETAFQLSSDSSDGRISNKIELSSLAVVLDNDSLQSHTMEKERQQCNDSKTMTTSAFLQVSEISDSQNSLRHDVSLDSDPPTVEDVTQNKAENYASARVATVVSRLHHSLDMPLWRRGYLLVESKEALLQALQERHGVQLQNNLHAVQHTLGCDAMVAERDSKSIPSHSNGGHSPDREPPWAKTHKTGCHRRRKQKNPQKLEPQLLSESPQAKKAAREWNSGTTIQQSSVSVNVLRPHSPEFFMDLQPSFDALSPVPVKTHDRSLLPRVNPLNKGTTAFIVGEKKCDTNVSFLSPTESFERNRKPFLKYTLSAPRNGSSHLKLWEECSADTEKSYLNKNSSPPDHSPSLNQYMQTYYPSHILPSTSKFYRLDMSQYPPSDRLEKGLSPRKLSFPFYPSPEHWSYPRMKLY
ncbi:uncharacterized protein si:dkey-250k15.4 isoform X2 [Brienomyrus brachyistius]|uniref:uncharacterized protein si:dkey-250k15.4 isoform X2 n=1 Tax=Brienomyrus brachyistius TaxID=42636 RepID=UPI0020B39283|nr:uncharacterized protein si:dkey-250k15.4 isoform X2 [Brienomyrus brachyistius]